MNYAKMRSMDITNGPGLRVSLFVCGCTFHCKNCFNENIQDFHAGKIWTEKEEEIFLSLLKPKFIRGATILGGEPLLQDQHMGNLLKKIKEEYPTKETWVYTGFRYEDIPSHVLGWLPYIDVLVDGQYIEEFHKSDLRFRGSENQRFIDIQKTLIQSKNKNKMKIVTREY